MRARVKAHAIAPDSTLGSLLRLVAAVISLADLSDEISTPEFQRELERLNVALWLVLLELEGKRLGAL